jgi:hypothetical protein
MREACIVPLGFRAAPEPQTDDFGVIVRGRSFTGEALAPSTAGDGWSLYVLFRDHIIKRGPWSVHEVNLQTEEVVPHYGADKEPGQLLALPDGRVYVPAGEAFYRLKRIPAALTSWRFPAPTIGIGARAITGRSIYVDRNTVWPCDWT